MGAAHFADRVILKIVKNRRLERLALKALIRANELLGLAIGVRLASIRDSSEPLQKACAEAETSLLLACMLREACDILASRWDKIPDRHRPQYTPEQRYRILRLKSVLALGKDESARRFRVSPETIARWEREARTTETDTSPALVRPHPPVRRFADVVRQLVHTMRLAGFGGYEKIAQTLARAGWKVSKTTVGRILREKPPLGNPADARGCSKERALRADFPNHIFLVDLTNISGLFGLFSFKVVLILDVFSRLPLAVRVFSKEPTGCDVVELLRSAIGRFGLPHHLVSDQGSQFTSAVFRDTLNELGIRHRFGAIGKVGSIALLERLWRTLKEALVIKVFPPLIQSELELRLELGLRYYAFLRPHQGLGGATPAEIHFGLEPRHTSAVPPPRGRPGEGAGDSPFTIEYLDRERRLPYLAKAA
jgi:putative transposase